MKNFSRQLCVKAVAVLLFLVCAVGGAFGSLFVAARWDNLWLGPSSYASSPSCYRLLQEKLSLVEEGFTLRQLKEENGSLSYLDGKRLAALEAHLAAPSNFRYQLHDTAGTLLLTNLSSGILEDSVAYIYSRSFSYWPGAADGEESHAQEYIMEYGLTFPLTVEDDFSQDYADYAEGSAVLPGICAWALSLDLVAFCLLIFLIRGAGRQPNSTALHLNWQDKIPLDLYLAGNILALALLFSMGDAISYSFVQDPRNLPTVAALCVISLCVAGLLLADFLTLATRIKNRRVLRNTAVWRLCALLLRWSRQVFSSWPMVWRVVLLFLAYLLGTALTAATIVLAPFYQGVVLFWLCRWALLWRQVRTGTEHIVGGDPSFQIDTRKMPRDLSEHATQLNNLGKAVGLAVDERMKSERFKTELITNVSHDLKTPLTSIINYVDLLKKMELENPTAQEYIEVLDRKSQRLKKLTEDLVEASKASTGSLTVVRERIGMAELVGQALAEYEDKFASRGLSPMVSLPEDEAAVFADGRHLWRVIDNLFSNCYKYALEGTRVYVAVTHWDGNVLLSVKNISKQALNVPPEQLMERFVRGEEARSTEGSGLGLSIARSLTELQGGSFSLAIDGDLFKATLSFPQAGPLPTTAA